MEPKSLLKVSRLETGYGLIPALKQVDLEVRQGEIVTLLGSNGAGKSTTLNAISGVIPTWKGEVIFDGQRITGLHAARIVRLGLVQCPEGRQLFPDLTVLENLELGAYVRGLSRKQMQAELEKVYQLFPLLLERRTQLAGTLSGGQQQMLAIARALMSLPALLMMDEPSLGLAPLIVAQLFKLIKQINELGTTILLVEQNARASLRIADRAYVLESGQVVLQGSARELLGDRRMQEAYLGA